MGRRERERADAEAGAFIYIYIERERKFALRQEHVYTTRPAELCEGCSDTAAVDVLKA